MITWLLLLTACLPKPVDKPSLVYRWQVDRAALPDGTLRAVHVARSNFREALAVPGGGKHELHGLLTVFVYEHPNHGLVLVDAGFGRRTAVDPGDYPGRFTANAVGLEMGVPVADRLTEIDHEADDVAHVIVTHLHADHAGGIEDFPGAMLHVSAPEWDAGQRRRVLKNILPEPYADHGDVRTYAYDDGPYGPFPAHEDLFGDGSVILLPTPGHTPGHTSVLVNLRGGSLLFTGDVAWIDANWQEPVPKGWLSRTVLEHDWKQGMDALWRIRDWAQRHPDLVVVAGHEPANIERLASWPAPLVPGSPARATSER